MVVFFFISSEAGTICCLGIGRRSRCIEGRLSEIEREEREQVGQRIPNSELGRLATPLFPPSSSAEIGSTCLQLCHSAQHLAPTQLTTVVHDPSSSSPLSSSPSSPLSPSPPLPPSSPNPSPPTPTPPSPSPAPSDRPSFHLPPNARRATRSIASCPPSLASTLVRRGGMGGWGADECGQGRVMIIMGSAFARPGLEGRTARSHVSALVEEGERS